MSNGHGIFLYMRVRKELGYLFLVVVGILSIISSVGAAWLYVNLQPIMADQKIQTEMVRLQAAAHVYYRRLDTYRGVCSDIGVRQFYSCNEKEDAFAVSVERPDGTYYCTDSTGQFGEQMLPIKRNVLCTIATP